MKSLNLTASNTDAYIRRGHRGQTESSIAIGGQKRSIAAQVAGWQDGQMCQVVVAPHGTKEANNINQSHPQSNKDLLKQEVFLREIAKMRMQREMLRFQEQEVRLKRKRIWLEIEESAETNRLIRLRIARSRRRRFM